MLTRVLVVGASGMLGGSIFRFLSSSQRYQVLGTVRSEIAKHHLTSQGFSEVVSDVELTDISYFSEVMRAFKPQFVINCVGVIKQLDLAKQYVPSIRLNSLLPHQLAEVCTANGAQLIHFSTDCVFNGDKGNYSEGDLPDSNDLYGRSKLLGEVTYDRHITFRTSIIGHENNSHVSLVDWFLSQECDVNGYAKSIFSGMPTVYIAEIIDKYVFSSDLSGLYHLGVSPIDKYKLLSLIKSAYAHKGMLSKTDGIEINRSLNSSRFYQETGFVPVEWSVLIGKMKSEYEQYFSRFKTA